MDRQRDRGRNEIAKFYSNFHSYRFVGPYLVIRLQRALSEKKLDHLRQEFLSIIDPPGEMFQRDALPRKPAKPKSPTSRASASPSTASTSASCASSSIG